MSKEKFRYSMIYNDIKNDILNDVYKVGSLLPTEQVLSLKYDVNRSTLRKAMQMLADEGLIEKCPGKGTIVKQCPGCPRVPKSYHQQKHRFFPPKRKYYNRTILLFPV